MTDNSNNTEDKEETDYLLWKESYGYDWTKWYDKDEPVRRDLPTKHK